MQSGSIFGAVCITFQLALMNTSAMAQPSTGTVAEPTTAPPVASHALWNDLVAQDPWVFLGDSNTYAGGYVAILDAWLDSPHVSERPKLLNLGMSSETASGLSEEDHPFPRPCVHQRLAKTLAMLQPQVVFVAYGMNDGIYAPPDEERFDAFRSGMRRLCSQVRASGARLIVLTPPPFEAESKAKRGGLGPSAQGRYAYFAPYPEYDQVLEQQRAWILRNELQADCIIDVHALLDKELQRRLATQPDFGFTRDGIHFSTEGHALIAEQILVSLNAPAEVLADYPEKQAIDASLEAMHLLRDAYLSATGKNRPGLPAGWPVWYAEKLAAQRKERDSNADH